jgi:hypothetical protein
MKRAIGVGATVGLALWVLGACGSSAPVIKATDYDQTCNVASDCAVIDEGSSCCYGCGNAAINKKDLTRYQADLAKRRNACAGAQCPAYDCAISNPACTAGKCAICRTLSCDGTDAGADSGALDSGAGDSGPGDAGSSDAKAD